MLAKSLNELKNIWKSTYKVVVLTAHGVGPASDVDHVDGRAVDTKDYINAIDNHAEEGEEGRARSRRGLEDSKQARTLSRTEGDPNTYGGSRLAGLEVARAAGAGRGGCGCRLQR